tara:strand:- start:3478 stop:3798 length:321 start_codon:yes stop_codon:yes gene_type:complete
LNKMENLEEKHKNYIKAKEKVRHLKIFYMHLVGYFIIVALLLYNLYIVEGEYENFFIWFNSIILIAWTIFIIVHGWNVFKGRILFKESWEDRKLKEYLERDKNEIK